MKSKVSLVCYFFMIFIFSITMVTLIFIGKFSLFDSRNKSMPSNVIIYDRSNEQIIMYDAVTEIRGTTLYIEDAIETKREDVSNLVE